MKTYTVLYAEDVPHSRNAATVFVDIISFFGQGARSFNP
jgi:hypothetical protein